VSGDEQPRIESTEICKLSDFQICIFSYSLTLSDFTETKHTKKSPRTALLTEKPSYALFG